MLKVRPYAIHATLAPSHTRHTPICPGVSPLKMALAAGWNSFAYDVQQHMRLPKMDHAAKLLAPAPLWLSQTTPSSALQHHPPVHSPTPQTLPIQFEPQHQQQQQQERDLDRFFLPLNASCDFLSLDHEQQQPQKPQARAVVSSHVQTDDTIECVPHDAAAARPHAHALSPRLQHQHVIEDMALLRRSRMSSDSASPAFAFPPATETPTVPSPPLTEAPLASLYPLMPQPLPPLAISSNSISRAFQLRNDSDVLVHEITPSLSCTRICSRSSPCRFCRCALFFATTWVVEKVFVTLTHCLRPASYFPPYAEGEWHDTHETPRSLSCFASSHALLATADFSCRLAHSSLFSLGATKPVSCITPCTGYQGMKAVRQ